MNPGFRIIILYIFNVLNYRRVKGDETVFTPNGPVIGRKIIAANGEQVFTFQGIPYAVPPIGILQFQYPRKVDSWVDLARNASAQYRVVCLQKSTLSTIGSVDCLHLSIFALTKVEGSLSPVFVWIHNHHSEGGISSMSPESGYADNIAARGIVAVTLNYRLGVLSLNETINLGFKDQQMALEWIQENIEYFGGDPRKVTLAGSGSGAEYVLMHIKDKTSKGLFSAAILQSGQYARDRFMDCEAILQLKERIQCHGDNLQCLNRKSPTDLIDKSNDLNFVPCISHFDIKDPIVNKVPVIIGFNSNEAGNDGIDPSLSVVLNRSNKLTTNRTHFSKTMNHPYYGPHCLEIFRILYKRDEITQFDQSDFEKKLNETAIALGRNDLKTLIRTRKMLMDTYMTPLSTGETWFNRFTTMSTEANFHGPMLQVITLLSEVDVYTYNFQHISQAEMIGLPWRGVTHGAELQYLFAQPGVSTRTDLSFRPTTRDLNMVNILGSLWGNFVKYRNPTPQTENLDWIKVDPKGNIQAGQLNHVKLTASPRLQKTLTSKTVVVWINELPNYSSKAIKKKTYTNLKYLTFIIFYITNKALI